MYSPSSRQRNFHPSSRCRYRLLALYWVSTRILRMSELMQFESVKSMIR